MPDGAGITTARGRERRSRSGLRSGEATRSYLTRWYGHRIINNQKLTTLGRGGSSRNPARTTQSLDLLWLDSRYTRLRVTDLQP